MMKREGEREREEGRGGGREGGQGREEWGNEA